MTKQLPLDLLFLLLIIPAQVELSPGGSYFLVLLLILYLAVTLWQPLPHDALPLAFGWKRLAFLLRFLILLLILLVTPVTVTIQNIQARLQADARENAGNITKQEFNETYLEFHDGALQVEAALNLLAQGKNPYAETYYDTHLTLYQHPNTEVNPAVEHMIYLPGILLLSGPFRAAFEWGFGFYDQRILYLLAYVVALLLLPLLTPRPNHKLALMSAVGLGPWLSKPIYFGMNDILVILFFILVIISLQKEKFYWAAIWLGIAATMKQSAWLIVPFFLVTIYQLNLASERLKKVFISSLIIGGIMLVVIAPLALWDLPAFIDDTFAYAGGTASSHNYPIRGYTIGHLLLSIGTIPSSANYYPFWRLQAIFGLPLLLGLLFYQYRQKQIATLFLASGCFILGLGFVSRFFQENYIGFTIVLLFIGFLMSHEKEVLPIDAIDVGGLAD